MTDTDNSGHPRSVLREYGWPSAYELSPEASELPRELRAKLRGVNYGDTND